MGLLRKALFLGTGGASGLVVKANSKKERTAKAAEKQLRLQRQQAKAAKRSPAQAAHPPLVADELSKLVDLYNRGFLTPDEFAAQKARLLGTGQ